METLIGIWLVSAVICGILGAVIGNAKNAPGIGFFLGLLLLPVGVLIACLIDARPECPKCREHIQIRATICPHCRQNLRWANDDTPNIDRPVSRPARDSHSRNSQQNTAKGDDQDDLVLNQFLNPLSQEKPGATGSTAATGPQRTEQLAKLKAARDDGVLTEEEFQRKKAELLSRP